MSEPTEIVGDQLRTLIERIEHVEEEIKELTEAKKEIYLEAKGNGFDPRYPPRGGPRPKAGPKGARRIGVPGGHLFASDQGRTSGQKESPRRSSRHRAAWDCPAKKSSPT